MQQRNNWTFTYRRLSKTCRDLLYHGTILLKQNTAVDFSPQRRPFGRTYVADQDPFRFILMNNSRRPPEQQMMVLRCDRPMVLFPGWNEADLKQLVSLLDLTSEPELVLLQEVIRCDYGMVRKGSRPRAVKHLEDARQLGIDPALDESIESSLQKAWSVWWQQWGGELFACLIDPGRPNPLMQRTHLAGGTGDFSPVPYYLRR